MSLERLRSMYGYIFRVEDVAEPISKASGAGEGSRGGKVVGHTRSGKPIYDSREHEAHKEFDREDMQDVDRKQREIANGVARYPENLKEQNPIPLTQQRKTFLPVDGTNEGFYDAPGLKRYKKLLKIFKMHDIPFQGHITYNSKTDKIAALSKEAPQMIRDMLAKVIAAKGA